MASLRNDESRQIVRDRPESRLQSTLWRKRSLPSHGQHRHLQLRFVDLGREILRVFLSSAKIAQTRSQKPRLRDSASVEIQQVV